MSLHLSKYHIVGNHMLWLIWCCHILTDKVTDAERTKKNAKNVYPVMEVVSVAVKIVAQVVRSAYVPNKYRTKNDQTDV